MQDVAAFAILALLLTITPGPDTFLVLRSSLSNGVPGGLASSAGILVGLIVWALAAATGIAALLLASHHAFRALQLAGGLYLCWLGLQSLLALRSLDLTAGRTEGSPSTIRSFRTGLLSNLTNPKVGVFYVSVLPPFVPAEGSILWPVVLSAIHLGESAAWLAIIAFSAARLRTVHRRPSFQRFTQAVAGSALLASGAFVLAGTRRR